MEEYRVLITTSGMGSRLGKLTDFTNKCLVRVGGKAVISHIVDSYPDNTHFVITLGHFGEHVRQYLKIAHEDSKFTFCDVDNYKGKGSSQLLSMLSAESHLQCPFVFHACDTIIDDETPSPSYNWVAAAEVDSADQYRTINLGSTGSFVKFNEKGEIGFDYAYPGVCGIKDYKIFWHELRGIINSSPEGSSLSDCGVINKLAEAKSVSIKKVSSWLDTGSVSELERARKDLKQEFHVLDKPRENIYFIDDSVIKFFYDKALSIKRVERAGVLEGLVPEVVASSDNYFKYKFAQGDLFAKSVNPKKMLLFLNWADENMWKKRNNIDIEDSCKAFYFEKTEKRARDFLAGRRDVPEKINNCIIPSLKDLVSQIDKKWLCDGKSSLMHGDLILDNVIETNGGFCLIDWRQDFAGMIGIGDMYYDLAKLNHNLVFNHEIVDNENYTISFKKDSGVMCDILCSKNLIDCREVLHEFIVSSGLDLKKVEVLTALIWINMSPLHESPLDKFLFNFGKYNLNRALS